MKNKKLISGGILATIGFLLSPLSWWNDIFINIPIAYLGGWLASLIYKPAFPPAFVAAYWLTNLLGFILMHLGVAKIAKGGEAIKIFSKNDWIKYLVMVCGYTALMMILAKLNIIKPIAEYFK